MTKAIWPKYKLEVIGVTGEISSGKTLFLTTIDPARTLIYDIEKSAGTYEDLGFTRVDVPGLMAQKYPKGVAAQDLFKWWLKDIEKIEPGKYSVIAIDPASDIEHGMVEWVANRYKEFGFKTRKKGKTSNKFIVRSRHQKK
jgi:hypothetical protein